MPAELVMPRVSPAMQEATVVQWLKKEGDPIHKDEIVVMIESEKASQDVEALTDGVLYKIAARIAGDVVPVNKPLAIIRLPQDTPEDLRIYESSPTASSVAVNQRQPVASSFPAKAGGVIRSSPLARKLAESRGIDLAAIPVGSGPGGRIVEQDVLAFCEAMAATAQAANPAVTTAGAGGKRIPLSRLRQHAINRLRQSKDHTIPVTSVTEIDLTDLMALYKQIKPVWQAAHQSRLR